MKIIISFIILSLHTTVSLAQPTLYKGKVIDSQTGKGISDIHLYSEIDHTNGNITNTDGNFVIRLDKSKGVYFTHISYEPLYVNLEDSLKEVVITLKANATTLKEVVVSTLSAEEIMKRASSSLKKNHEVEPVFYKFYTLLVHFNSADSTIHTAEEYMGAIYQNKRNITKFKFDNIILGTFTDIGKELVRGYRMISVSKMRSDNIFKYKESLFKKRKHKEYNFKLVDEVKINQRPCYVIEFGGEGDTLQRGEIFIDTEDFAVVRKTRLNNEGVMIEKVDFIKSSSDGKWYLHNVMDLSNYSGDNNADLRLTLYNKKEEESEKDYRYLIIAKMSITYIKMTRETYIKNINYIPLPNWIEERILEQE